MAETRHPEFRPPGRGPEPPLRRVARWIPFSDDVLSGYFCLTDPRTSLVVKAVAFGSLGYLLVGADMVPDAIGMAGYLDDGMILVAAVHAVAGNVRTHHRARARAALEGDADRPGASAHDPEG